jgi:DNA-binding PadR family transcriptional regulator
MVSEMTGYDFLRYCSKNGIAVSPGSVYPHLKALEEEGYVTSSQNGRKKTYRLSSVGHEWVEHHQSGDVDTEKVLELFQMTVSCQCGEIPETLCHSLKSLLLRLGKTDWHQKEQLYELLGLARSLENEIQTQIQKQEG